MKMPTFTRNVKVIFEKRKILRIWICKKATRRPPFLHEGNRPYYQQNFLVFFSLYKKRSNFTLKLQPQSDFRPLIHL